MAKKYNKKKKSKYPGYMSFNKGLGLNPAYGEYGGWLDEFEEGGRIKYQQDIGVLPTQTKYVGVPLDTEEPPYVSVEPDYTKYNSTNYPNYSQNKSENNSTSVKNNQFVWSQGSSNTYQSPEFKSKLQFSAERPPIKFNPYLKGAVDVAGIYFYPASVVGAGMDLIEGDNVGAGLGLIPYAKAGGLFSRGVRDLYTYAINKGLSNRIAQPAKIILQKGAPPATIGANMYDTYSDFKQYLPNINQELFKGSENMYKEGGFIGKTTVEAGGAKHVVYTGKKGDIMVTHPEMDNGAWDTINLTEVSDAKSLAQGVDATLDWHRKHPYHKKKKSFGGKLKYQQNIGYIPTREELINIGNHAQDVYNFYKNAGYTEIPNKLYFNEHQNVWIPEYKLKAIQNSNNEELKKQIQNILNKNIFKYDEEVKDSWLKELDKEAEEDFIKEWTNSKGDRNINFPEGVYRKNIDANNFYQRELQQGLLNSEAPMQLFNRSIKPQRKTNFIAPFSSDAATIYYYDPIAVKPYDTLTPEEQKIRIEKYGVEGTPFGKMENFALPPTYISKNEGQYGEGKSSFQNYGQTKDTPWGSFYTIYYGDPTKSDTKTTNLTPQEFELYKNTEQYQKYKSKKAYGGYTYQEGGRTPIYVDNPRDPRLQAYNDSLSLYKAYIMQDKLMGPNYDNENTNRRFAPPISDWTIKKLKEGRVKRIFPGLEDYGPISKDFQNERDMFKDNFFVTDADKKLINYYKSLGFNDDNIMYRTSADLVHPTIKAIGSYHDGSAWSPIYKKPVQPYVYRNPEIRAKQEELVNAGYNIGEVDGIWGKKSQTAWEEYQNKKNTVKKEEPKDRSILTYKITELPKEEQRGKQKYIATVDLDTYQGGEKHPFSKRFILSQEEYEGLGDTGTIKDRQGKDVPVKYLKKYGGKYRAPKYNDKRIGRGDDGGEVWLYQDGGDVDAVVNLPEFQVTGSAKDVKYPFYTKLTPEERKFFGQNNPIGRSITAKAMKGETPNIASDISNILGPAIDMGFGMTGIPGAYRFAKDPIGKLSNVASALDQAIIGSTPFASPMGMRREFTDEEIEGVSDALDAAGIAGSVLAPIKALPLARGLRAGNAFLNKVEPLQVFRNTTSATHTFDLEELRRVYHNAERFLQPNESNYLWKHGHGKASQYANRNAPQDFWSDGTPMRVQDGTTRTVYNQQPITDYISGSYAPDYVDLRRPINGFQPGTPEWDRLNNIIESNRSKPTNINTEPLNKSGLTKEEALAKAAEKDKDKLSKMTETEFENTVVKPNGEIVEYTPAMDLNLQWNKESGKTLIPEAVPLTRKEYVDKFNENIDLLNDIIEKKNKTKVKYKVISLNENGLLRFKSEHGNTAWVVDINPGLWQGQVQDIANADYYKSIPGLNMAVSSSGVFPESSGLKGIPGTKAYESINEYLKKLDLGRVKPGFNSQTETIKDSAGKIIQTGSKDVWENFINSGRGVGFYGNPSTVYGSLKSALPYVGISGTGSWVLNNIKNRKQEYKQGGWLDEL